MTIYGYVRVSSKSQREDRQLLAMADLGIPVEHIYVDKITGKNFDRASYKKLISRLRPGDLIYIKSIDRLGRNYTEIINNWRMITNDYCVDIAVIDLPLLDTRNKGNDLTGTFISDLTLQILSYVAQAEADAIRERQASGIQAARARGVKFGGKAIEVPDNFPALVKKWERGKLSLQEVLEQTGLKESTFYRRLRELRASRKK